MKLFHTSDWHLGKMLYGYSLLEDQRWFLENAFLPAVEREKPACVVIAGDVYDRQVPPVEAISLLDGALCRLMEQGVKVCLTAGNHDGPQRMALLKGALAKSGVYFSTCLEDAFSPLLLEEGGEKVQLFLLPYFDAAQARDFLGDTSLRGEAACMEALLGRMLPLFQPGAAHVLVAHCFAAGATPCESESVSFVGGSGQVPPALFAPFDYAALGHLHGPQTAGEKGRYCGSPLKYSVDEAGQAKGYVELRWDGRRMEQAFVPLGALRDVRRVEGLFSELLRQGELSPCPDYVDITLLDEAPVLMAADRLRPFYPRLLSVRNPWMAQAVAGERAARLRGLDEPTIFATFLRDVCGAEATPQDLELFRQALEDLGDQA